MPRGERLAPYVLVAPAVLVIVVLRLYPLALGVNFSFTGDGDRDGTAVGLDNYVTLFGDPLFLGALRNVGLLVLLLPVAVAIPGLLATFIGGPGRTSPGSNSSARCSRRVRSTSCGPGPSGGSPTSCGSPPWPTPTTYRSPGRTTPVGLLHAATAVPNHLVSELQDLEPPFGVRLAHHVEDGAFVLGDTAGAGVAVDEHAIRTAHVGHTTRNGDGPHVRPSAAGHRLFAAPYDGTVPFRHHPDVPGSLRHDR